MKREQIEELLDRDFRCPEGHDINKNAIMFSRFKKDKWDSASVEIIYYCSYCKKMYRTKKDFELNEHKLEEIAR